MNTTNLQAAGGTGIVIFLAIRFGLNTSAKKASAVGLVGAVVTYYLLSIDVTNAGNSLTS